MAKLTQISVNELKERCTEILRDIPLEGLIVTKDGVPIARLEPIGTGLMEFYGCLPDAKIEGDIFSTGIRWHAEDGIL